MMVCETDFFKRLKPRLQGEVLDCVYKQFYTTLEYAFLDCDHQFKRQIISHSRFHCYLGSEQLEAGDENRPVKIVQEGKMSTDVHFIVSGKVHIMNKQGLWEYGSLEEGAYFGDISAFTNEPNQFSYYFNHRQPKGLFLLSINIVDFLNICGQFKFSHELMKQRAQKKAEIFEDYRTIALYKYIKCMQRHRELLRIKSPFEQISMYRRRETARLQELRGKLFDSIIQLYRVCRAIKHKKQSDRALAKEDQEDAREEVTPSPAAKEAPAQRQNKVVAFDGDENRDVRESPIILPMQPPPKKLEKSRTGGSSRKKAKKVQTGHFEGGSEFDHSDPQPMSPSRLELNFDNRPSDFEHSSFQSSQAHSSLQDKSLSELREALKATQQELYSRLCRYLQSRERDYDEARAFHNEFQRMVPSDYANSIFRDYLSLKEVNQAMLKETPASAEDVVLTLPIPNLEDSDNEGI